MTGKRGAECLRLMEENKRLKKQVADFIAANGRLANLGRIMERERNDAYERLARMEAGSEAQAKLEIAEKALQAIAFGRPGGPTPSGLPCKQWLEEAERTAIDAYRQIRPAAVSTAIPIERLTARAQRCIRDHGWKSVEEIAAAGEGYLRSLPQMGQKTVRELLQLTNGVRWS